MVIYCLVLFLCKFRRDRIWIAMEFCGGGSLQDIYHGKRGEGKGGGGGGRGGEMGDEGRGWEMREEGGGVGR